MSEPSINAEVIIVGGGPSGLAAAKTLADAKIKTIVLEKGDGTGSKNFFSGVVSDKLYNDIFGKPIIKERIISEFRAYFLDKKSFNYVNQRNENFISVLRESFNRWMSKAVEKAGASIEYKTTARELLINEGKIIGVKTDNGNYFANVVIIAEGTNSLLTKQAGLKTGNYTPEHVFLFVEEDISIPSNVIEERLNLQTGCGMSAKLFTSSFFDIPSIALMHTNKNSISLSIGVLLSGSISKAININQFQENLKKHPAIKSMVKDGKLNNYSSFMLPISLNQNYDLPPTKLFTNGCLIIGGAAMLINPFSWDLSYLAITSGKIAAESVIKAKELNDYSEKTLSIYEKTLRSLEQFKELKNQNSLKPKFDLPFIKSKENQLSVLLNNKNINISEDKILESLSSAILYKN